MLSKFIINNALVYSMFTHEQGGIENFFYRHQKD